MQSANGARRSPCGACGGSGKKEGATCPTCKGSGKASPARYNKE